MKEWADALGGHEASTKINSLFIKEVIEYGGLNGTVEQWYSAKDTYRNSIIITDVVSESIVFDVTSGEGWILDSNGQLQPLQGQMLKDIITGFYFNSFWHFLISLSSQGKVQILEENETSTIISLSPQGGSDVIVYLDTKTNLPLKSESSSDGHTWTTVYSDWRQFEGLWWPYQQTLFHENDTVVASFQIESIEANIELRDDLFQLSEPSHEFRIIFENNAESIEVPLMIIGNQLFLQVRVNGSEPLRFLLDSGAAGTAIIFEQIDKLGLNTQGDLKVRGFGEDLSAAASIGNISLALPGLSLHGIKATAITHFAGSVVGILGSDLFSQLKVTLDYENETLTIFNEDLIIEDPETIQLPLMIDGNHAYIDTTIAFENETIEGKFLIDTGAYFSLLLNTPFIQSYKLLEHVSAVTETSISGQGVGGQTVSQIGRAEGIKLGDINFENPIIHFSQDQGGGATSSEFAGVIGGELLRRLTLTFDYENQTIALKPNGHFNDPFYYDLGGMVLGKAFGVSRVLKGSSADRAGIKRSDLILSVDQQPVYDLTVEELYLRYSSSDKIHAVEVMQGAERKVFHLSLQPII